jgi:hypothetical protein
MRKKLLWIFGIGYIVLVILLHNVFETALGEFLMQVSYFALAFGILWFIYRLIKHSIQLFLYKRNKKEE